MENSLVWHESWVPLWEDGVFSIPEFLLESSQILNDVKVTFRLHGKLGKPLIFVLGGISAHRGLNFTANGKKPWWQELVGSGLAIDTNHYCVCSFDYLGGHDESTGPRDPNWQADARISTFDQAKIAYELAKYLGYQNIHRFIGASYGGMVALACAVHYPHFAQETIVMSAAHRSHPMAMAWRYIQREIVALAREADLQDRGLKLARALGMTTYRSPEEFGIRFRDFHEVVAYLESCGQRYIEASNDQSFCCLSASIDDHEIFPQDIKTNLTVIGVWEDRLVPPSILQELAEQTGARIEMLSSLFGHDAFLKETARLTSILNPSKECARERF